MLQMCQSAYQTLGGKLVTLTYEMEAREAIIEVNTRVVQKGIN
jgi:hypothetical protein